MRDNFSSKIIVSFVIDEINAFICVYVQIFSLILDCHVSIIDQEIIFFVYPTSADPMT